MSNARHTLQLVSGPMHVDITEAPKNVHVEISGAQPMAFEQSRVMRFLAPLIFAYESDRRPMSVGGRGSDFVGHVTTAPGLGVVLWATPAQGAR